MQKVTKNKHIFGCWFDAKQVWKNKIRLQVPRKPLWQWQEVGGSKPSCIGLRPIFQKEKRKKKG